MSDVQQEKTGLDPGLEEELKQRAAQQLAQSVTPGGTAAAEKTGTPPAAAPTPAAAKKQPQGVTLNEQPIPIDPATGRPVGRPRYSGGEKSCSRQYRRSQCSADRSEFYSACSANSDSWPGYSSES